MLRDLVSREQVENKRNFPKNNYFCYRWRVKDNFNRSIDRQMFHLSVHGADNHKGLMSHKILQLHKSRFKGNRKDLVVSLAQDAMSFLDKRRMEHNANSTEQVLYSSSMIEMVDMCFNLLLSCATELNTILGLSELFITATEPNFEVKDKIKETVCSRTQCRFSTSLYSLVVEGRRETINFYIVPSDELIAAEDVALQFQSITKWSAAIKENDVVWMSQGMELSDEVIEVCAIQLLGQLIEKTKERLSPIAEQEKESEEYPLFEEDPWLKGPVGYTNSDDDMQTATSTSIQAIKSEGDWKMVDYPPYQQPEQYAAQNSMELQTLDNLEPVKEQLSNTKSTETLELNRSEDFKCNEIDSVTNAVVSKSSDSIDRFFEANSKGTLESKEELEIQKSEIAKPEPKKETKSSKSSKKRSSKKLSRKKRRVNRRKNKRN